MTRIHRNYGQGWYVQVFDARTKETRSIPLRFGRKIDAEKSAAKLNKIMPATTIKEARSQVVKIGVKKIRELMVEDLAW